MRRLLKRSIFVKLMITSSVALGACSTLPSTGASVQTMICSELESLTPEEIQSIFDTARGQLEAEGVVFDGQVWSDPDTHQRFLSTVENITGCSTGTSSSSVGQALHEGELDATYCGPGHNNRYTWRVSACLNRVCYEHDSCYSRCSQEPGTKCTWGGPRRPCDEAFFLAADACDNTGARFKSAIVIALARGLYLAPGSALLCPSGMSCPTPATLGLGPCATNARGEACTTCLALASREEPGCVERLMEATDSVHEACDKGSVDPLCLTADCPATGKCYGVPSTDGPPGPPKPLVDGSQCSNSSECSSGCCLANPSGTGGRCGTAPTSENACLCTASADCKAVPKCSGSEPPNCSAEVGGAGKRCDVGCG